METLRSIFNPTPSAEFEYLPILIIALALFTASFFMPLLYKNNKILKPLIRNFPGRVRLSAILILFYLGLRYENIPFLSMPFFFFLIILIFAYFVIRLLYIILKKYPKEKGVTLHLRPNDNQLSYDKYLPKPKRKK